MYVEGDAAFASPEALSGPVEVDLENVALHELRWRFPPERHVWDDVLAPRVGSQSFQLPTVDIPRLDGAEQLQTM